MKKTEELQEKINELKKRISVLIDEFNLENGESEIVLDLNHTYALSGGGKKVCIGRYLDVYIKIQ